MNLLYKIYCRTFQGVFKLAIPVLPYRNPKIIKSIFRVPEELKAVGCKNALIVTDKTLNELGKTESLKKALQNENIAYTVYDGTIPNPTVKNVEEAREIYVRNNCDCLIGFGGGSSIDCAKAVGARIARPKKSVMSMGGILKVARKIPYLVAIPTTSGTGSEVTVTTVITDNETGHKSPISDFPLIPRLAVLDIENTKSLPPSMTSTTGMDALTHAVEAYIGRSTTKSTRKDAEEAVLLIFQNLERAYKNGNDETARANMMTASFLAGRAFSKSYVGYIHAVAHSLGGQYNIPHGLANAVLMPLVLEEYGSTVHKKLHKLGVIAGVAIKEDTPKDGAEKFINAIKELNTRMGIPKRLSGIKSEDISKMAKYAEKEANPLYPVPLLMTAEELEGLYIKAADWSLTQ